MTGITTRELNGDFASLLAPQGKRTEPQRWRVTLTTHDGGVEVVYLSTPFASHTTMLDAAKAQIPDLRDYQGFAFKKIGA